jgi:hypothetical protein
VHFPLLPALRVSVSDVYFVSEQLLLVIMMRVRVHGIPAPAGEIVAGIMNLLYHLETMGRIRDWEKGQSGCESLMRSPCFESEQSEPNEKACSDHQSSASLHHVQDRRRAEKKG